ncbi:hypothetical protein [Actinosynnema sp. NPDC020468]|uniref:hypothetical protein n=1 Tax=Actinosynnema sp. NPDC020468 TaxID=3154488 RepID=UPI0033EE704C
MGEPHRRLLNTVEGAEAEQPEQELAKGVEPRGHWGVGVDHHPVRHGETVDESAAREQSR